MLEFRADLHCHSICSDGTDSPAALLRKAKEVGLAGLSITDHDSIEAYTPDLFTLAAELEIRLLTGIELSSEWQDNTVHILGYNIDIHSTTFQDFLARLITRRDERNILIIEKLKKKGFLIDPTELKAFGERTIGRPHIAQLMVQKGYVSTIQTAFQLYLGEGCSCFSAGIKYTPAEVIEHIHLAGGRAILAHPHFIKKRRLLAQLLELRLDGLECYYGTFLKHYEKPWVTLAEKRKWIATGGSDYHGTVKPHIQLGCSWVKLETFELLATPLARQPN